MFTEETMLKCLIILILLSLSFTVNAQEVDTLWTRSYNGPACDEDYAIDLEIDSHDNIYVLGYQYPASIHLIKYAPNADIVWIKYYFGAATASTLDNDYIYITGHSGGWSGSPPFNMVTHKIDLVTGDTIWTRTYAGNLDNAQASDLCVDNLGNVYITGFSEFTDSGQDIFTIKYAPDGDTVWTRRYNSSGQLDDAVKIMVDKLGNVIIAGNIGHLTTNYCIIKYDNNGTLLWDNIYNPGTASNSLRSLTIDNDNNILASGTIDDGLNFDFLTIKYYPNGDTAWVRTYDSMRRIDIAFSVQTDIQNNVYVTGSTGTIKYDSLGTELWQNLISGNTLCLEDSSYIYVSASTTAKLTTDGNTVWTMPYTDKYHDTGGAVKIKLDSEKNLIKIGNSFFTTCASTTDYMTVKYHQDLCCINIRGNVDGDTQDEVDISDLVFIVDFIFTGGLAPTCREEANVDGDSDEQIDISDLVALVDFIFTNGQSPTVCPY